MPRPSSSASRYCICIESSMRHLSSNFLVQPPQSSTQLTIHAPRPSLFSSSEAMAEYTTHLRDGPSRHSPFSSAEAISEYTSGIRDGPPPPDSWRAFAAAAASGAPGGPSLAHLHQLLEARWSAELGRPRWDLDEMQIDLVGNGRTYGNICVPGRMCLYCLYFHGLYFCLRVCCVFSGQRSRRGGSPLVGRWTSQSPGASPPHPILFAQA